ncbi:hemin ABC transporter substrate-binding protein [Hahella sp. CCB-MM4]|uniref:heme/hemin ABC transporter substrate-binding protein n=1 Tax=Hahella sp. (strain CCB-MM4) TaxID=1926491 RepID=UPI000B9A8D06|nr:ABC transporter substrate-binding protein [Hahella sp. CCB-MM4]OZG75377.1 hemin ABC transporter substrate-binding protein [Hahella sp. CCB-MM4]
MLNKHHSLRLLLWTLFMLPVSQAVHAEASESGRPFADSPDRIISIGGAITETIYALGLEEKLIASDTTSYFPEAAEMLPKVGYQRALSAEGILSLNPRIIIATEEAGPRSVIEQVRTAGVEWITLSSPQSLTDVYRNIEQLGTLLGAASRASQLVEDIQKQELVLQQHIKEQGNSTRILFVLQHTGGAPMIAGSNTAADHIIELAGAENALTGVEGYKPMTPESVVQARPDLILTTVLGLQQVGGVDSMLKVPGLALTPAGQQKRVVAMDSLLLLGFGPRTVTAAEQLRQHWIR